MKKKTIMILTPTSGLKAFINSVVIASLNKKNHGVPAVQSSENFKENP